MSYPRFLQSIFGKDYQVYAPHLRKIHIYSLFVAVLFLSLTAYTIARYQNECTRTFEQRVHALRSKYATVYH